MLTVGDRMAIDLIKVNTGASALSVAQLMAEKRIGSLLVEDGGKVAGIITETDLVRKIMAKGLDAAALKCSEVMSAPLKTIESTRKLFEAAEVMDKHHIRHLAVEEDGEIKGVISVRDLIHPEFTDGEGW
ncbi:MAG: CBS domain-containing protein [Nitrospinae bacterium]|nr:CBS domain-containing protein [Nitrospinota bacterium]